MSSHECGACDGSGVCENSFHDGGGLMEALRDVVTDAVGDTCPACGGDTGNPGNCSSCGGTGTQDD